MTITTTQHGERRLRKRIGIPKRAVPRHLERVVSRGKRMCFSNRKGWRKWADWARVHYSSDVFYTYGNYIYAFAKENCGLVLITVLYLPNSGAWAN